jgi:putative SOS response-associated peptidase YedK
MCGRFSIAVRIGIFSKRFGIGEPFDCVLPRYNIAPTENVPVVVREGAVYQVSMMRWGLRPSRATGERHGLQPINARAEGLEKSRIFRDLLVSGRCLVPATGFYEWRDDGGRKVPFYISRKDHSLFAIAGLFDTSKDLQGNEARSFTLVTTAPNDLVVHYHDRMPAILSPEGEAVWADNGIDLFGSTADILVPFPSGGMEAIEVSSSVNTPDNKTEATIIGVRQQTLDGF